jgi:hypothetical protein
MRPANLFSPRNIRFITQNKQLGNTLVGQVKNHEYGIADKWGAVFQKRHLARYRHCHLRLPRCHTRID